MKRKIPGYFDPGYKTSYQKQKDEIARLKKVPEQMAAHLVSAATDWMLKMDFAPDYRFNLVFYLAQEAKKFRSW